MVLCGQYTTDSKNVNVYLLEDCVRCFFPNFVSCCSPLYQPHGELMSAGQSNLLLQLGIHFLMMKLLFFETFGRNFDLF